MKLQIGKKYVVYTKGNYYENLRVEVLGWISKTEANKYPNFVENIAINEKTISTGVINMDTLVYFKCIVLDDNGSASSSNDIVILWEDIVDESRTIILETDYSFNLKLSFTNPGANTTSKLSDLIIQIGENIDKYAQNNNIVIDHDFQEIIDFDSMIAENKLIATEKLLSNASDALGTVIDMKTAAEKINNTFVSNDVNSKVEALGSKIDTITNNINTIIANLN